jgi:hypothetical protein
LARNGEVFDTGGTLKTIAAIRSGSSDGTSSRAPDPNWPPFLNTPPFPEHTSGHSTFSGGAAEVLVELAESDEFAFVTTSDGLPGRNQP